MVLRINGSRQADVATSLCSSRTAIFVGSSHEWLELRISFVKVLLSFLGANAVFEAINRIEFVHCAAIQLVYTLECLLPEGFLVVGQEQTTEFLSLEEVLAVVLGFWHGEDLCSVGGFVRFWGWVLSFHVYTTLNKGIVLFIGIFVERLAHDVVGATQPWVGTNMVSFLEEVTCLFLFSWLFECWLVEYRLVSVTERILSLGHNWLWISDFHSNGCKIWHVLIMLFHCFISFDYPFLLYQRFLEIFVLFFVKDSLEQILARSLIHL